MNSHTVTGFIGKTSVGEGSNGPVLSKTQTGLTVAKFYVRDPLPARDQERLEASSSRRAQWYECSMYGKQAEEFVAQAKVGAPVMLVGRLIVRQWDTRSYGARIKLELICERYMLFGAGSEGKPYEQVF